MLTSQGIEEFVATKVRDDLKHLYMPGMTGLVLFPDTRPEATKDTTGLRLDTKTDYTMLTKAKMGRAIRFGVSGWNYSTKMTHFISVDVDLLGDKKGNDGVTQQRMDEIIAQCMALPYIEMRYSTHGKGLLIRAFLQPTHTPSENAHAKLARTLIDKINSDTTLKLNSDPKKPDTDVVGRIAWIWSAKENDGSFKLIKANSTFYQPPEQEIAVEVDTNLSIEQLEEQAFYLSLNDGTQAIIKHIKDKGGIAEYVALQDPEEGAFACIRTHTYMLMEAKEALRIPGSYKTVASGSNRKDINCFCIPSRNGGLKVIRYGGTGGESDWLIDDKGRAYNYLNDSVPLIEQIRIHGGSPDKDNTYLFPTLRQAAEAMQRFAVGKIEVPVEYADRKTTLVLIDNTTAQMRIEKHQGEKSYNPHFHNGHGYLKHNFQVSLPEESDAILTQDEVLMVSNNIRHVVMFYNKANSTWESKARDSWIKKGRQDIDAVLCSIGISKQRVPSVCGHLIRNSLMGVNVPFGEEKLGPHTINITTSKLACKPSKVIKSIDNWLSFYKHIGSSLTPHIKANPSFQKIGIKDGCDYLMTWLAYSIRKPSLRMPYLFLHGPQETGKSLFHESMNFLISGAVQRGNYSLTNPQGFNGELMGCTHVVIEELDMSTNKMAFQRMKEFVTGSEVSIHVKGATPMMIPNYTHWIQCANDVSYCPVEFGDTRVTMIFVDKPPKPRCKDEMINALKNEAPCFLHKILTLDLPEPMGRLALLPIETEDKTEVMEGRSDNIQQYFSSCLTESDGSYILLSEAFDEYLTFCKTLQGSSSKPHTRRAFASRMRNLVPCGRFPKIANKVVVANVVMNSQAGIGEKEDGVFRQDDEKVHLEKEKEVANNG